jgi:sigma-B regulation protein RsbU (phosphoserine phosphatase)
MAELMNHFNKAVYSFSTADKYSTLFCGLLDSGGRRLTYVNAGQVCPLVLRAGKGLERLESSGFPVGLIEVAQYEQGCVDLQSGDTVVCFSDGISEATNAKEEMWDLAEVEKVLRACSGLNAQQTIDKLVSAADAFGGEAEQADDMTVVALRAV